MIFSFNHNVKRLFCILGKNSFKTGFLLLVDVEIPRVFNGINKNIKRAKLRISRQFCLEQVANSKCMQRNIS